MHIPYVDLESRTRSDLIFPAEDVVTKRYIYRVILNMEYRLKSTTLGES
jgi:hypothetical protein